MSSLAHNSKVVDVCAPSPFRMSPYKSMMWIFVIGDLLTFGGFIISMFLQRFWDASWVNPHDIFVSFPFLQGVHLPLVFTTITTVILMTSSLTMLLSVLAAKQGDKQQTARWLLVTVVLGLVFLLGQVWEWATLYEEGAWWGRNPFPDQYGNVGIPLYFDYFFSITGFHGIHVLIGLLLNAIGYVKVISGSCERHGTYGYVENVGIFWHFVDFVWAFVFVFLYLL